MKLLLDSDENENLESKTKTECKFCKTSIDLKKTKKLPKKLILEKHGLYWTGLEKIFLLIYKVQCSSCNKKYSHKQFKSEFLYK